MEPSFTAQQLGFMVAAGVDLNEMFGHASSVPTTQSPQPLHAPLEGSAHAFAVVDADEASVTLRPSYPGEYFAEPIPHPETGTRCHVVSTHREDPEDYYHDDDGVYYFPIVDDRCRSCLLALGEWRALGADGEVAWWTNDGIPMELGVNEETNEEALVPTVRPWNDPAVARQREERAAALRRQGDALMRADWALRRD